jgi:O-methyltransferase involved in polyketide biosynthesis
MNDNAAAQSKLREQSVQATMLIPLYGRAIAGRRFPDILRDAEAERITESVGYDFSDIAATYGTEYTSLCCLIRAARVDERARAFMAEHPEAAVVNLGSGLDDTFSRVDNGRILWYNLDLPDAIAYREIFIKPSRRCRNIAKSMFDYSWLDDISTRPDGAVLAIAAGLFFYFEETEIRALAGKLCERFPCGELFFDVCSHSGMKIANKMVRKTGNTGAEMKFWVDDAAYVKAWSPKIRSAECLPYFGGRYKDRRLKRMTRILMWGADFLRRTKFISVKWAAP